MRFGAERMEVVQPSRCLLGGCVFGGKGKVKNKRVERRDAEGAEKSQREKQEKRKMAT
jgi:hypothetical protein